MSRKLIICEKPSVARDVAAALPETFSQKGDAFESDHWVISHAVGHLLEQMDPEAYDARFKKWTYGDLPIIPAEFRYQARDARAAKQLAALHRLMARTDVTGIVNACDAGREGELIFKLILQSASEAARAKPVERAWFSSMTRTAIQEAFTNLRPDSEMRNLEDAARARSEADWLVGMNGTRAATTRAGSIRRVLSLGRVQTPTLAMIVRRDLEIGAFTPQDYWQVDATFTGAASDLPASWNDVAGAHRDRLFTDTDGKTFRDRLSTAGAAQAIADLTTGAEGIVRSVETRPRTENPQLLYDLTALQRDANQRFGFSASRTLAAAQSCYDEHKVLTYPRTSSRYLSGDMVDTLKGVAARVGSADGQYADGARQVLALGTMPLGRVVNDAKVTDHHAIIPTDAAHDLGRLGSDARRIYDMVARRFLSVFLPPARLEDTTIITDVHGHTFRSSGTVIVAAGWYAVDAMRRHRVEKHPQPGHDANGDDDAGTGDRTLPSVAVGQRLTCARAAALAKSTKPPARFNEGSLLKAMETAGRLVDDDEAAEAMKDAGLGTPATRANTIDGLIDREYIEREGKQLRATDKAVGLITMLGDHLLTSPELTGRWEQKLNRIQTGGGTRAEFEREITDFTRQVVQWFADKGHEDLRVERTVVAPCPLNRPDGAKCTGSIVEQRKSYSCDSYHGKDDPGCGYTLWKQMDNRSITLDEAREYIATGVQSKDLQAAREVLGPCPSDGCDGEITERGRSFGCTSWKSKTETGCGYVIWKRLRGRPDEVSIEEARRMVARGETNATPPREPVAACPVPGCGGTIVERPRTYGCNSWKSPRNRGCGYVIWKRPRGSEHDVTVAEATAKIAADRADPDAAGLEAVVGRGAAGGRSARGTVDADGAIARHLLERAFWTGLDGGGKVTIEVPAGSQQGLPEAVAAGLIAAMALDRKPLRLWCTVTTDPAAARSTLEQRLAERIRKALAPASRPAATVTA